MAKIVEDSFQYKIAHHADFKKSSMLPLSRKEKIGLVRQTNYLMFGVHRKKDNFLKTKQINLF